jgi:hypothetical protein
LYAEDTQIFIELTPANAVSTIHQLQKCLLKVQNWMAANLLKLNPDKTELSLEVRLLHPTCHIFSQ